MRARPAPGLVVCVVGGGAAGILAAVALARHPSRTARRIVVVEPRPELGTGVAYGTRSPSHLLNVRAAGMSALPDVPADFVARCRAHGITDDPAAFVPRHHYPAYLRATLADAVVAADGRVTVEHVPVRALGVRMGAGGRLRIETDDGGAIAADRLLLATGHGQPGSGWPDDPRVIADPWSADVLATIGREARVTIVGSGLTAVDVVLALDDAGHRGPVRLLSRHGLLPMAHAAGPALPRPPATGPDDPSAATVLGILRALRVDAAIADDPRATADALRPATVALWRGLGDTERRRFLRHALRHWETVRHRMAPEVATRIDGLRAAGRLRVERGRVVDLAAGPDGVVVTVSMSGRVGEHIAGVVIRATGPSPDPHDDPLLARLIAEGSARPHPLGIGLDVEPDGRIRRADGSAWATVRALGSLRKGAEWECTAVPELRLHARDAAAAILGDA
ncbi:MAG: FAD/NAD(P)-binding protein [Chloroflexota bacterium]